MQYENMKQKLKKIIISYPSSLSTLKQIPKIYFTSIFQTSYLHVSYHTFHNNLLMLFLTLVGISCSLIVKLSDFTCKNPNSKSKSRRTGLLSTTQV